MGVKADTLFYFIENYLLSFSDYTAFKIKCDQVLDGYYANFAWFKYKAVQGSPLPISPQTT